MGERVSKFRLSSSAFERKDDNKKVLPKRMIFLSVEGAETERNYFEHLNNFLDSSLIQIEVLRRKRGDGYSAPEHAIELLEEYLNLRKGELLPNHFMDELEQKYGIENLRSYLEQDNNLKEDIKRELNTALLEYGIDLEYRRYLQSFDKETDYFAVVIDRDCGNHDRQQLEECIRFCATKNYGFFLTNPCFEFWLLLHLCDVEKEFTTEEQEELLENTVISNRHTKVSFEVSKRAKHRKVISFDKFKLFYYPNIELAIQRTKHFATKFPQLLDSLGSNLPELFQEVAR